MRVADQGNSEKPGWPQLRAAVLGHYGTACACCGAAERLSIDHVEGNGARHRQELFGGKSSSQRMYRWLVKQGFPDGFQTLCLPCNQSKGNGRECKRHNPGAVRPAVAVDARRIRMRQVLAQAGGQGMSVSELVARLAAEGAAPQRETVHRWLAADERQAMVRRPASYLRPRARRWVWNAVAI